MGGRVDKSCLEALQMPYGASSVLFFFGRFCRKIVQNLWAHTQRHEAHGADAGTWCSLPKCVCPQVLSDFAAEAAEKEQKRRGGSIGHLQGF